MIEDDAYRTSTQYRYWSYTRDSLAYLRQSTNELASEKVRAAVRRVQGSKDERKGRDGEGESGGNDAMDLDVDVDVEVQTLTVEEELKIVEWGCTKIMEIGEEFRPRVPRNVVATAIQYLRRFYLTNSPMTYHPKQIMTCALYLATKADHFYIGLSKFVAELPGVTDEDVKAPEFLLLQGLRFTLEVRHPMRGLNGGHVEMSALANEGKLRQIQGKESGKRIGGAADQAKKLLSTAAQMTDAYFLYTPSQIWIAAVMVADRELMETYLAVKLESLGEAGIAMQTKLMSTINECAELLRNYKSPEDDSTQRKEMKRIGKKLAVCQNPEKLDIVAMTRAKIAEKREGSDSDVEKAKKKRKLEREKLERDGDVFGPDLKSVG